MKVFVFVVCVLGVVAAESTVYRNQFQRQEQTNSAPYPASGFRPSREFLLPTDRRDVLEPRDPRTFYGYPDSVNQDQTTTDSSVTTDDPPTTTDSIPTTTFSPASSQLNDARALPDAEVEEVEATNEGKSSQADVQPQQGIYYVLLPTGQLQRVEYFTRVDDVRRMAYSAQLKYANVQPITGPIYAYDPKSAFLQLIA